MDRRVLLHEILISLELHEAIDEFVISELCWNHLNSESELVISFLEHGEMVLMSKGFKNWLIHLPHV